MQRIPQHPSSNRLLVVQFCWAGLIYPPLLFQLLPQSFQILPVSALNSGKDFLFVVRRGCGRPLLVCVGHFTFKFFTHALGIRQYFGWQTGQSCHIDSKRLGTSSRSQGIKEGNGMIGIATVVGIFHHALHMTQADLGFVLPFIEE
jgi:hypothetical protein